MIEVGTPPLDFSYDDPGIRPYLLYARDPKTQQELFFVGVKHFYKTSDHQFPILTALWETFATHPHWPSNTVLLHEGGGPQALPEPEQALQDGEGAYLAHLAWENGVPFRNGEPYVNIIAHQLIERFGADIASYFEYMKFARQYIEAKEAGKGFGSFDLYVQSRHNMEKLLKLDLYDFSQESLQATHERLYPGTPMNPTEPLPDGTFRTAYDYRKMFWPIGITTDRAQLTQMQEAGLYYDWIRDNWLLNSVLQPGWELGQRLRIFVQRGLSHAVALEPHLEDALGVPVKRYVGAAACQNFMRLYAPG